MLRATDMTRSTVQNLLVWFHPSTDQTATSEPIDWSAGIEAIPNQDSRFCISFCPVRQMSRFYVRLIIGKKHVFEPQNVSQAINVCLQRSFLVRARPDPQRVYNKRRFEKARIVHFARFVVLDAPYGFDFSNPCNVRPLIDDYYSFTDLSVHVFREISVTHR